MSPRPRGGSRPIASHTGARRVRSGIAVGTPHPVPLPLRFGTRAMDDPRGDGTLSVRAFLSRSCECAFGPASHLDDLGTMKREDGLRRPNGPAGRARRGQTAPGPGEEPIAPTPSRSAKKLRLDSGPEEDIRRLLCGRSKPLKAELPRCDHERRGSGLAATARYAGPRGRPRG